MRKSVRIPLPRVRVVRGVAGSTLHVGKKRISVAERHIYLIECFLSDPGRVIPYETLGTVMKWGGRTGGFRHCLRQYVLQLRMILRKEKVHAHFAVAEGIGYALCEPAKNSSGVRLG